MSFPGYAGTMLFVDLTSGSVRREPLPEEWVKRFIGGYGINNRLAYEVIPPDVEPLSPENALILGAGPFAGTLIPGAAKILLTTKFPINGAFATASGGGHFALMLKTCGFDHVVITGKAPRPVYLKISPDGASLEDAAVLWGKDAFDTVDFLRSRHEPCSVIPTTPAGENLVRASITSVDKAGTLGRGGLAAVMASKNLKALVAVKGDRPIRIADRLGLLRLVDELHRRIMNWQGREAIINGDWAAFGSGESSTEPPPADIVAIHKQCRSSLACACCPLADKSVVRLREGKFAGLTTYMPHLWVETFSGDTGWTLYENCVKLSDTLDRLGICHMTFSALFWLVCRLYREGVIDSKDTEGLELRPDFDTALKLARLMAYREGFGDVLADGLLAAARRIGKGAEKYVSHIKGHAIVYDPRLKGLGTMEFEEIVNPRGSHVASGGSPAYEPGRPPADFARHGERMGIPEEAIKRLVTETSFNVARYTRYSEDWYALFNSLSLCNRAFVNRFYHVRTIAALYSTLTGISVSPPELMKAAERAWNMGKHLNVRAGFSRKDDRPPEEWFRPRVQKDTEYRLTDYYRTHDITPEEMDRLLDEYYEERGYDKATGALLPEKLAELGLPE